MKNATRKTTRNAKPIARPELWELIVRGVDPEFDATEEVTAIKAALPRFLESVARNEMTQADGVSYGSIAEELEREYDKSCPRPIRQQMIDALNAGGVDGRFELDVMVARAAHAGFILGTAFTCRLLQPGGAR